MGQTTKGIRYPSDYSAVADVPADMQTMAEDIDEIFQNFDEQCEDYALITETGNKVEILFNNSTFKISIVLKDKNDNIIYTSNEIDLPIEELVSNIEYSNESLVITYKNGQISTISLENLISDIEEEQIIQNTEIEVIENCIDSELETATTQKSTELEVTDSANYYSKLDFFGREKQKQLSGKNLLDTSPNNTILNAYFDSVTGQIVSDNTHSNCAFEQYIKVKPNTDYTMSSREVIAQTIYSIVEYDQDKNIIKYTSTGNYAPLSYTLKTQANTAYIRIRYKYSNEGISNEIIADKNIQLEEGSTATPYEEYCGGQASPNRRYQQEIQSVEGNITVKKCNKNLFKKNSEILSAYITNSTVMQGYLDKVVIIPIQPNKSYHLSGYEVPISSEAVGDDWFILLCSEKPTIGTVGRNISVTTSRNLSVSFTSQSNENWIAVKCAHIQKTNLDLTLNTIQLEEGSTATSYVEHKEQSIDFTLSANQKMYEGDYFHQESGKWYLHNTRNQRTINGTEGITWTLNRTLDNCIWFRSVNIGEKLGMKTTGVNYINLLCDKFIQKGWNTSIYQILDEEFIAQSTVTDLYLSIEKGVLQTDDVAGLQEYLSSEGLTINYPLETPTDTEITDTTQIERLEQLQKLLLEHGTNYIWTETEGLNPNLQLTYKKSNLLRIENIESRLALLE